MSAAGDVCRAKSYIRTSTGEAFVCVGRPWLTNVHVCASGGQPLC